MSQIQGMRKNNTSNLPPEGISNEFGSELSQIKRSRKPRSDLPPEGASNEFGSEMSQIKRSRAPRNDLPPEDTPSELGSEMSQIKESRSKYGSPLSSNDTPREFGSEMSQIKRPRRVRSDLPPEESPSEFGSEMAQIKGRKRQVRSDLPPEDTQNTFGSEMSQIIRTARKPRSDLPPEGTPNSPGSETSQIFTPNILRKKIKPSALPEELRDILKKELSDPDRKVYMKRMKTKILGSLRQLYGVQTPPIYMSGSSKYKTQPLVVELVKGDTFVASPTTFLRSQIPEQACGGCGKVDCTLSNNLCVIYPAYAAVCVDNIVENYIKQTQKIPDKHEVVDMFSSPTVMAAMHESADMVFFFVIVLVSKFGSIKTRYGEGFRSISTEV